MKVFVATFHESGDRPRVAYTLPGAKMLVRKVTDEYEHYVHNGEWSSLPSEPEVTVLMDKTDNGILVEIRETEIEEAHPTTSAHPGGVAPGVVPSGG